MKNDLVSIVVPVYNVEKYLKKCIDSILNQTYKNLEIILVDDGSTDNSGKICDDYSSSDERIKVIHKQNGGLSDARNLGIDNSTGKYITFIDSDDYITNNYIEYLVTILEKNNADISICDYKIVHNEFGFIDKSKEIINIYTYEECIMKLLYGTHKLISACGKLYKKNLFKLIRYPKNQLFEDINTTYKTYFESKNIVVSNLKMYMYLVRNDSITTSKFNTRNFDQIRATDEMCSDIIKKYPSMINGINRRKLYSRISVLCKMINANYEGLEKNMILDYIIKNGNIVLNDKNISFRDRFSIKMILHNEKMFEKIWKMRNIILKR